MAVVTYDLLVSTATTFLLLLVLSPSLSYGESEYVLDTSGKPLEVGSEYYIHPAGYPIHRGLGRVSGRTTAIELCPNFVGLPTAPNSKSIPATFTPIANESDKIQMSSDISISFAPILYCRMGGTWELRFDPYARRSQVMAQSFNVDGESKSAFRIIPVGSGSDGYKIASCPKSASDDECHDLGVSSGIFGERILGFPDSNPLVVVFTKAVEKEVPLLRSVATS